VRAKWRETNLQLNHLDPLVWLDVSICAMYFASAGSSVENNILCPLPCLRVRVVEKIGMNEIAAVQSEYSRDVQETM
jgi:hypothetical protein